MNKTTLITIRSLVCLLAWPVCASAQTTLRPSPLDAQAATPPLIYRSPLASYRKLAAESPPLGWREANDAVERAGGWRALAREANAPEPAASAPPAPASAPRATRPAPPTAPAHRH
jgi:hypothetical protein